MNCFLCLKKNIHTKDQNWALYMDYLILKAISYPKFDKTSLCNTYLLFLNFHYFSFLLSDILHRTAWKVKSK